MYSHSLVIIPLVLLTIQTITSGKTVQKIATSSSTTKVARPLSVGNRSSLSLDLVAMRDITNAFTTVANDASKNEWLLVNMFNLSSANPIYDFRLPQVDDSYLTMQKSDFLQPIFPNLTSSYVRLMKNKHYSVDDEQHMKVTEDIDTYTNILNTTDKDDPTLYMNLQTERNFIEYLNEVNREKDASAGKRKDNNVEWSLLGLDGWKGGLSIPNKRNPAPIDEEELIDSINTSKKQKWDLPGRVQENLLDSTFLQDMRNTSILKAVTNYTHQKYPITNSYGAHLDTDVYIGRVNDPFGHSTKWNFKNSSSDEQVEDRKKRGVIELYSMIKCSTGCDPIIFKGYGCYCGFLGDGLPVDGIDQCCKLHDKCYINSNCIPYLEYFVPYIWKCYRGKPLCAIDHGEWGGPNSCSARLCKCDLSLSQCLRRFICPQRRAICRSSRTRMLQNFVFNF